MKKLSLLTLTLLFFTGCSRGLVSGTYLINLKLQDKTLPFVLINERGVLSIQNSEEKIELKRTQDRIFEIPPYDAAIEFTSFSPIQGYWVRYNKEPEYKVAFEGEKIKNIERFEFKTEVELNGDYQITITSEGKENSAIGTFITENEIIKGSIVTTTGDYRFLEGYIKNNKLHLYGFDGIFAYIFEARVESDQFYDGKIWGGKSWQAQFNGKFNPDVKLESFEYADILKEKDSTLSFTAETLKGEKKVYHSTENNKVKIIQIFGSWCPNCQDETAFFSKWYPNYKDSVELMALSFERSPNKAHALKSINKTLKKLDPNYPFYLASVDSSENPDTIIPQIKKIPAYPTTFILDKKGIVREVHTGFNGPATGRYFSDFKKNLEKTIQKLLKE